MKLDRTNMKAICRYCRKNEKCSQQKEILESDKTDTILGCVEFDFNGDPNYFSNT